MEPSVNAVCCTRGQNYSDRRSAHGSLSSHIRGFLFDFLGDCDGHHARLGTATAWPDSRSSLRWHSLACTARLPLGTTNLVRRFSPLAEGLW